MASRALLSLSDSKFYSWSTIFDRPELAAWKKVALVFTLLFPIIATLADLYRWVTNTCRRSVEQRSEPDLLKYLRSDDSQRSDIDRLQENWPLDDFVAVAERVIGQPGGPQAIVEHYNGIMRHSYLGKDTRIKYSDEMYGLLNNPGIINQLSDGSLSVFFLRAIQEGSAEKIQRLHGEILERLQNSGFVKSIELKSAFKQAVEQWKSAEQMNDPKVIQVYEAVIETGIQYTLYSSIAMKGCCREDGTWDFAELYHRLQQPEIHLQVIEDSKPRYKQQDWDVRMQGYLGAKHSLPESAKQAIYNLAIDITADLRCGIVATGKAKVPDSDGFGDDRVVAWYPNQAGTIAIRNKSENTIRFVLYPTEKSFLFAPGQTLEVSQEQILSSQEFAIVLEEETLVYGRQFITSKAVAEWPHVLSISEFSHTKSVTVKKDCIELFGKGILQEKGVLGDEALLESFAGTLRIDNEQTCPIEVNFYNNGYEKIQSVQIRAKESISVRDISSATYLQFLQVPFSGFAAEI